ncbi:MAG: Calx-beta domain-containing protein, partial [Verrucomicrobiota bacterium]
SYAAPADLRMEAVARDPAGVIRRVAFFDGEKQVGVSELDLSPPTTPGLPLTHVFTWRGVPAGEHVLSARAPTASGQELRSAPVVIRVAGGVEPAVVTVDATRAMTSEPGPAGPALPGVFTLRRTGPVTAPLKVLYAVSGTARNGVDYSLLDGDATFPAGSATREILVEARTDATVEGPETVILSLRPDAPYRVGAGAGATVMIADAPPATARLALSSPVPGRRFTAPADIPLQAAAVDPSGWIGRVDFLANGTPVAVSELVFIRAPDPGAVLRHEAVWTGAQPGSYRLTARARTATGQEVVSAPVEIVVAGPPPAPWAVRELPDRYVPGTELEVRLALAPPPGSAAVAVEDQPPKNWAVGAISDGGTFDAATGRVKFRPFLDH